MTVRVLWCGGEGYALSGHGYSPEGDIRHDEMAADMGGACANAWSPAPCATMLRCAANTAAG